MSSLKTRLAAAKQRLRPTETHVLTPAGNELIERRDESGQSSSTVVNTNQHGFVVDTRPDMQLAEVESGLFLGGFNDYNVMHYCKLQAVKIQLPMPINSTHTVSHILSIAPR